jgi:cystinosin
LTIEFPLLNVVGFGSYTISTAAFLYSPVIKSQYAARHHGLEPTVRFNDLIFGIHAVILVVLTYSQFYPSLWGFSHSDRQRANRPVLGLCIVCALALVIVALLAGNKNGIEHQNPHDWAWIDLIYTFGYIKLAVTFAKYMPQAWLNYKRKSTQGWSIHQILFDLTGGVLSMIQLVIDASFQDDWSGITGNPLKFGLSVVSSGYDLLFIVQHYILYRESDQRQKPREEEPLLQQPET